MSRRTTTFPTARATTPSVRAGISPLKPGQAPPPRGRTATPVLTTQRSTLSASGARKPGLAGMPRKEGGKYDRRMSFDDVKDERMLVMVDKLCVWMGGVLGEKLNRENLITGIRNGGLMCRLAEEIQVCVDNYKSTAEDPGTLPKKPPQGYKPDCSGRSMEARENVMKFLNWARELRVPESSIFSPDDLLKLKGKMNVVNTLLAIARRAKECGMAADIDAPPKIANAFKGLEEKFGKKFDHTAAAFGEKQALKTVDTKLRSGSAWKIVQQKFDAILQLPGKPAYEIFRA